MPFQYPAVHCCLYTHASSQLPATVNQGSPCSLITTYPPAIGMFFIAYCQKMTTIHLLELKGFLISPGESKIASFKAGLSSFFSCPKQFFDSASKELVLGVSGYQRHLFSGLKRIPEDCYDSANRRCKETHILNWLLKLNKREITKQNKTNDNNKNTYHYYGGRCWHAAKASSGGPESAWS